MYGLQQSTQAKYKKYEDVVKLVKTSEIEEGSTLSIIMDGDANEALAFLKPPDHWSWRTQKLDNINLISPTFSLQYSNKNKNYSFLLEYRGEFGKKRQENMVAVEAIYNF